MTNIYGIKNCTTMRKAFAWCDEHGVAYAFHDFKKDGVPRERLLAWCQVLGWKTLLNTQGQTFRKLTPEQRDISTQSKAIATMLEYPGSIKRPVVETEDGQLLVGFDPNLFASFVK